jgi:polar amino acid transport system substrate-binding protein
MRTAAASLIIATLLLAAPASAQQLPDPLRIATEGAYAPFNYLDDQGKVQGFEIDLARAMCDEIGANCEFVVQDWDGIIPGLLTRKYDAIIASMSITEERLRVVDFTDRYYSNVLAFAAARDRDLKTDKDGLKGLVIGAQRATIAGLYLEDNLGDTVEVKLYDTQDNAYLDLAAGRLDGLLSDKFPAYNWLQSEAGQGFEFKGDDIDIDDKIGIAVRKNDPLKEKFNAAIKAIVENGTYETINARYFPFSIY